MTADSIVIRFFENTISKYIVLLCVSVCLKRKFISGNIIAFTSAVAVLAFHSGFMFRVGFRMIEKYTFIFCTNTRLCKWKTSVLGKRISSPRGHQMRKRETAIGCVVNFSMNPQPQVSNSITLNTTFAWCCRYGWDTRDRTRHSSLTRITRIEIQQCNCCVGLYFTYTWKACRLSIHWRLAGGSFNGHK